MYIATWEDYKRRDPSSDALSYRRELLILTARVVFVRSGSTQATVWGSGRPPEGNTESALYSNQLSHAATPVRRCLSAHTQNAIQHDEENTMSLPRSDYDPRRVCVNPFPFLNNVNLGKQRRTFGVYVAGGLVSPTPPFPVPYPLYPLTHHSYYPFPPSSLLDSGHSLMPLSSLRTRTHHITSQITLYPCTSPSQIGSPVYARSSAFSS
jgi:hypothetical protein